METAVAQGKILYAGSSNFAGWHIAQARPRPRRRHFTGLVSEQSIYNLLTRDIELEVIPAAQAYGLGLIPWSPLHGGLLGGVLRKEREGKRRVEGRAARRSPSTATRSSSTRTSPPSWAMSRATSALAWLLHQPAVTAPIIGPRTSEQLDAAVRALDVTLDDRPLDRLDEIFPGLQDRSGALRLVGGESQERRRRRVVPASRPSSATGTGCWRGRARTGSSRTPSPDSHVHGSQRSRRANQGNI